MLRRSTRLAAALVALSATAVLAGCSNENPLNSGDTSSGESAKPGTIIVGSAQFPENAIIAQVYAQALEANGIQVKKRLNIGQRDAYLKALQDGSIDLIPEYSGNLLQFYDKSSTAKSSEDVYAALNDALPDGFEVLEMSEAQDKDSYNVTPEFSAEHDVTSLADLKELDMPLKVGGNPELGERPYGIPGLKEVYDVENVSLVPISDSGGPLTVKALLDGTVQLADIFSTTPAIKANDLVTLEDPENMIIAQNVVPLINSTKAGGTVTDVLNTISAELTTEDLIDFNAANSGDAKKSASAIAKDWLAEKDLF